jgi:signal transduction histidine kinase
VPGLTPAEAVVTGVLGLLIIRRQPRNPIGWIFLLGLSLLSLVTAAVQLYSVFALRVHPGLPLGVPAAWLSGWLFIPTVDIQLTFMVLLFPDGRLPSAGWRPFGWALAAVMAVAVAAAGIGAWPTRPLFHLTSTGSVVDADRLGLEEFQLLVVLGSLGCLFSLVRRFQAAAADLQAQIKWFLAGAVVLVAALGLTMGVAFTGGPTAPAAWTAVVYSLASVAVPVTMAIAILRYRLYDIDLVISRTLVYAALAAFITGVYVGIVVGLGSLLGGAGRPNLGLSILATALVAVAFQPLRERLQRLANRLVYGRRASPYEVLAEFSRQVGGEESLQRMAEVLCQGTGAEQAAVYFGERRLAVYPPAANGAQPGEERWVEVRHQGRRLGRLLVRKRRGETLTPLEEKLLSDLAHQAGLVLSNVGLTADLRARLEELRASRQRLVQAQDQERRRLERNLHDGAQQHLVSLKVRLGLAQSLAQSRPEKVPQLLQELQAEADSTLATMRELAHGIYPPLLAERGLRDALEAQARRATLPVSVEAEDLRRYPQEVEAAVYFCVLEALQNVQKYARASTATVRLREAGGELRFEVRDDGCGFDPATTTRGAGLTNMHDRLDALGAQMTLTSQPGRGTRVAASIPLWREPA